MSDVPNPDDLQTLCANRLADVASSEVLDYVDDHPGHWIADPNHPSEYSWWQNDPGRVMIVLDGATGDVECHADVTA